jgi:hypothetical protein
MMKYALFAGAGYLAYKQGWLSVLGIGSASAPVVAAAPGVVPSAAPVAPAAPAASNVLDHIYAGIVAAAAADKVTVTGPDVWDVYAVRSGGPNPMPAPEDVGLTRVDMTAAQYWTAMAPYLKTKLGLSGLGIYGGLGQLAMRCGR